MNRRMQVVASFFAAFILASGIASAQTNIKPGWNLFSPQDDVQIGQVGCPGRTAAADSQ